MGDKYIWARSALPVIACVAFMAVLVTGAVVRRVFGTVVREVVRAVR